MANVGGSASGTVEPGDVPVHVFLSYRRDDVPDAADRLARFLIDQLGRQNVFLDVDSIDIGVVFAQVIGTWVERCDVLLAVIGRGWIDATDEAGNRRLDDPRDYVRLEIEAALARGIRVVPVRIHGARLPKVSELPESLVPLLDRNAVELSRAYWDFDVDRLLVALRRVGADTGRQAATQDAGEREPATRGAAARDAAVRETTEPVRETTEPVRETAERETAAGAAAMRERSGPETAERDAAVRERAARAASTKEGRTIGTGGRLAPAGHTAARVGSAIALAGAIAVLASLPDAGPNQDNVGYWLPVALMSAGVIALVGDAVLRSRRTSLIGATALACALLGVTFPLSWHLKTAQFPAAPEFWLGAVGGVLAASGAAIASWNAYAEPSGSAQEPRVVSSQATRVLLIMPGPLIVIASLFALGEWSPPFPATGTTVHNWHGITGRYPIAMLLLSAFVIILAAAGIRPNRTSLLAIAGGVACLVLGESVPLIFTGAGLDTWGPGRWLRIAGAVLAVASLVLAAGSRGAAPSGNRRAEPRA
jgi:hypothetical protein